MASCLIISIRPASEPRSIITLTFSDYGSECEYDFTYVYDGNSTSSPLLATETGSPTPPPTPITAYSGQVCLAVHAMTHSLAARCISSSQVTRTMCYRESGRRTALCGARGTVQSTACVSPISARAMTDGPGLHAMSQLALITARALHLCDIRSHSMPLQAAWHLLSRSAEMCV